MADGNNRTAEAAPEAGNGLRAEDIFQKLFECSPDGIVETNQHGQIVRINPQIEKMFGYRRGELAGHPINLLVPERHREAHAMHTQQYVGDPRTRSMGAGLELCARRKDGSEFPVDIMLSPVCSDASCSI